MWRRAPLGELTDRIATDSGVSGVIVVAALVVTGSSAGLDALTAFGSVVGTVLVFWSAKVFAGIVADRAAHPTAPLRASLAAGLRPSWGLLIAMFLPAVLLLLGVTKAVPDEAAMWAALWTCVGVLALLGFSGFRAHRFRLLVSMLGAVVTAGFGMLMVLLRVLIR